MELLEVLRLRRRAIVAVAALVSLTGIAVTAVFPGVLPPRPLSGAAVGLAACFLAVAVGVALDATDRLVRGPRHVRTAGARLAATTTLEPSAALLRWVDARIRQEPGLRLAVAAAGSDALSSGRLTDAVGTALARNGWRVLVADLSHGRGDRPGVAEVCRGERRLGEVAQIHATLQYARLGAGQGLAEALHGFPSLTARLPRDVDVLLAALPGLGHPGTLPAAAAADRALVVARADVTIRAELVESLDALDRAGVSTDVVLVHGDEGARRRPRAEDDREQPSGDERGPEADRGPDGEPDRASDGEPERASDGEPDGAPQHEPDRASDGEPERASDGEPDRARDPQPRAPDHRPDHTPDHEPDRGRPPDGEQRPGAARPAPGAQPVDRPQRPESAERPEPTEPPEPTGRIVTPAGQSASERRRSVAAIAPYFATASPVVSDDDPTGEIPRVRAPQGRPPPSAATTGSATGSPAQSISDDTGQDTGHDTGHATGHDTGHDSDRAGDQRAAGDATGDRWGTIPAEPTPNTPGEPEPSLRLAVALDALVHEVWGDDDPRPR